MDTLDVKTAQLISFADALGDRVLAINEERQALADGFAVTAKYTSGEARDAAVAQYEQISRDLMTTAHRLTVAQRYAQELADIYGKSDVELARLFGE